MRKIFINYYFLVGLVLCIFILKSVFASGLFSHQLDEQILRLFEMNICIKDFQVPCRWTPHLGGLYGTPLFNFVPPAPYYFGAVFYLIFGSLIISYKLMFIISFIGAYIFTYLLGRSLWGDLGGSLSGIFYSLAPYHALSLYIRGDIGELWALMLFPALIWGIVRLWQETKVLNAILLSLFIALLILSDILLAILFLPVAVALILVLFLQNKNRYSFRLFTISVVLGLLLSAFYFLPAVTETSLVHDSLTAWPHFAYTEHFKGIFKLVIERSWGYGVSVRETPFGAKETLSYQIGWIHLLGWFLSLLLVKKLIASYRSRAIFIIFSSLIVMLSIFMIHPKSQIIWQNIWFLKYLQYPWRFLSIIIFFISLMVGGVMLRPKNQLKKVLLWLALTVTATLFNLIYFKPEKIVPLTDADLTQGLVFENLIKKTNFEFLPVDTKRPPSKLPSQRYEILSGDIKVSDFVEKSNQIIFHSQVQTLATIRLATHYFPAWQVKVDSKEVIINPRNELGLITFAVDPGNHQVEVKLINTPIRIFGNLLSLIGFLMFLALILTQFPKTRRWLDYYLRAFN